MPKWDHTLNLQPEWKQDWDDSTIAQMGNIIADRLQTLEPHFKDDSTWADLVEDFRSIIGYDNVTAVQEFDHKMIELYEWADHNRVWIKTAF